MDKVLKEIRRQAEWANLAFELAGPVVSLCNYIGELAKHVYECSDHRGEQLAALEQRLAKVESFRDAWLEVYVPPEESGRFTHQPVPRKSQYPGVLVEFEEQELAILAERAETCGGNVPLYVYSLVKEKMRERQESEDA